MCWGVAVTLVLVLAGVQVGRAAAAGEEVPSTRIPRSLGATNSLRARPLQARGGRRKRGSRLNILNKKINIRRDRSRALKASQGLLFPHVGTTKIHFWRWRGTKILGT